MGKSKEKRKVYGKKTCQKCNGDIGFYKNERGNFVPCELNGDDHWDICRERRFKRMGKKIVNHIFDPEVHITYGKAKEAYSGKAPPWDE